ncbi:hypothetical protein [Parasphingorhabdus sp.]
MRPEKALDHDENQARGIFKDEKEQVSETRADYNKAISVGQRFLADRHCD